MIGMRTLFDKIWDNHVVAQEEDEALLYVDRCLIHEGSRHTFDTLHERGLSIAHPDKVFAFSDHYIPTDPRARAGGIAGIADPEKFFASAAAAGLHVTARQAFPDHHNFTAEEAGDLIMRAEEQGLALLTTEKDRARMAGDPAVAALASRVHVLPAAMHFEDVETVRRTVLERIATARRG